MPTPKIGLLVAGMHRSGTSAVARLLNILGAAVPGNLMPPHAEINAKGFWESFDVSSLNDELLNSHRSRWDDVLSIPLDDTAQESWQNFESKATELLDRDFADTNMFVLKDPRICRLLPYWIRLFERLAINSRIIIPIRHPLEVTASLKRRDNFPEEKSLYLWLRHIVDTERTTRNVPRTFVLYDDLLENWQDTCARIAGELGIIWPNSPDAIKNEVNTFLDAQMRHHRRELEQLADTDPIARWAKELFLALQVGDRDVSRLIDHIFAEITPSETMLAPILQDAFRQLKHTELLFSETKSWGSELDTELKIAQHEFNRLNHEFDEKSRHVDLLQGETAQLKASLSSAANALDERTTELKSTQQAFKELAHDYDVKSRHVGLLQGETEQLKATLSSTANALDERTAKLNDSTNELNARTAELNDSNNELNVRTAELNDSTNELNARTAELQHAYQKLSDANATIQARQAQLQAAAARIAETDSTIRTLLAASNTTKLRLAFWKRNKDLHLLEDSPLFDAAYYLSAHLEVLSSGMSPQEHYLKIGAGKGWDPHSLFSTSWYLEKNRDVAQGGMNPLVHFLRYGAKEKRSPHPLFDTALYLAAYPQATDSGLNALEHYLQIGGIAAFRPHWLFDGKAYLDSYPEVRESGINPLLHYLQIGHLKNYRPHWAFDPDYYFAKYPETADTGLPPLLHFITQGAKQHLNPSADFDIRSFLQQYPYLEYGDENPLVHHVRDCDYQTVFNPAAPELSAAAIETPVTPIHNEEPGRPLPAFMDFLYDEFGEAPRTEIVARMQRFHLPFTSEKIAPKPTDAEITDWLAEIAALSNTAPRVELPDVSIVIPVYNQLAFTLACIHSVLSAKTRYSYEIIVADDRSTDRTTEIFAQDIGTIRHVLCEQNQGFIRNCNNAAKHAKGRFLVLLNNDTIVLPGWLDELIGTLDNHPDIGLAGSKLLYPDGRLQEAGGIIFDDGSGWNYGRMDDPRKPQYCYMRDADYVSGASIALRTEFWRSVGGFDEQYSVAYYEDTDMAFRVRQAGLRVVVQSTSQLLHFEGISSGTDTSSGAKQYQITNSVTFSHKWREALPGHGKCDSQRLPADRTVRGRILVIDACTPTPDRDSGSMDTFQYLRILKSFGLHVTFVPENIVHFGHYTTDLQRLGIETLYAPYWRTFEDILKALGGSYDLVLIYRAPVAAKLLKSVRRHAPQAKVIFDTVDLHFLREEREAQLTGDAKKARIAGINRKIELDMISRADATIVLSNHEMEILSELTPQANLYEIPIVRDIPGRGPLGFSERQDIVFIGGFRHAPNVDAVKWFITEVWDRLRSKGYQGRFVIVGSDLPPEIARLRQPGIEIRGFVPDIADVFHACRISIAPLRYGAGLKGKVISSLSFGVPVVATSIAVEGGGFVHGQNVMVADDPDEVADTIISLYDNHELWEDLSRAGLEHCVQSFSVAAVSKRLQQLISDIAPDINYAKPN